MTCKNCGSQIPENENICPKCGALSTAEDTNISAAGAERTVPRGFSPKRNIIIIIITAILLIGSGITAVALISSYSASSGVSEHLQLAERYLSEQNYEQAVIEFLKVLEIEPMNVDAYLGLADAYIGLGQTDKAIEVLREGLEKTGDERISVKLDGLLENEQPEETEQTAESETPPDNTSTTEEVDSLYGTMGSVTILGEEYDIATTTHLDLN